MPALRIPYPEDCRRATGDALLPALPTGLNHWLFLILGRGLSNHIHHVGDSLHGFYIVHAHNVRSVKDARSHRAGCGELCIFLLLLLEKTLAGWPDQNREIE